MVQLIVFGFAVNLDVDHARIAWMDMDRTPASRDLRERFEGSGRFDVVALPLNESEVHEALDRGTAQAVIRVLPNFERDIKRGTPTQVQVLVDGTNSNTAELVSSYAQEIVADYAISASASRQNARIMSVSPGAAPESLDAGDRCAQPASGSIPISTAAIILSLG